jgi:hypothetical protein
MVCSAFSLKGNKKDMGMYMVGVSASFTDSLIYFTDIQHLDSVSLDKSKLLPMRGQYSDQLKNYLENKLGLKDRTCFIYFDVKKAKLEKTMKKMKDKYKKDGKAVMKEIGSDFQFTKAVEY